MLKLHLESNILVLLWGISFIKLLGNLENLKRKKKYGRASLHRFKNARPVWFVLRLYLFSIFIFSTHFIYSNLILSFCFHLFFCLVSFFALSSPSLFFLRQPLTNRECSLLWQVNDSKTHKFDFFTKMPLYSFSRQ